MHPFGRIDRALRRLAQVGAALARALAAAHAAARPADGPCAVQKQANVPATMRDGIMLLADVYRPPEAGSYPVIPMRLPYNKDLAQTLVYAPPQVYA
jgi:hypothetical protein